MEIYAVGGHVVPSAEKFLLPCRSFCFCWLVLFGHLLAFLSSGFGLFSAAAADVVVIVIHDHVGEGAIPTFFFFLGFLAIFLLGLRLLQLKIGGCSARHRPRFRRRVTLSLFASLNFGPLVSCGALPVALAICFCLVRGRPVLSRDQTTDKLANEKIHSKLNLMGANQAADRTCLTPSFG